jgi:hypothetical protein
MLFLPIVFVIILYRYPAGLLVYWITTNLWTIGQQLLIRRYMGPPPAPPTKKSAGDGGDGPVVIDTLEFQNILANLAIKSTKPIDVSFIRSTVFASLTLSPDALIGLHIEGGVAGKSRPASRLGTAAPMGLSAISMASLRFDQTNIVILGGGPSITTEAITITKLRDGRVGFWNQKPTDLDATIEKAVARNIRWQL